MSGAGISRTRLSLLATATVALGLVLIGALSYPNFASWAVLRNLLVDNAFLGVAAAGATVVILSGGIDLSVGSLMALTSTVLAVLVEAGVHPLVAMGLALLCGLLFGALQGWFIRLTELPPFLVTLGGLFLARGLAFVVAPQSLAIRHPFVTRTLRQSLALELPLGRRGITIPPTVFVLLFVILLVWFLLRHTRWGRAVHAIGDRERAALLMGVPVERARVQVYAFAGALSALAGILFALYQSSGDPASCRGLELDVIAAVVIGGTLLEGGVGSVIGTLFGVAILGLIQTLVTFQGDLNSWWTRIAVGGLMLAFLLLHRVVERLAGGWLAAKNG